MGILAAPTSVTQPISSLIPGAGGSGSGTPQVSTAPASSGSVSSNIAGAQQSLAGDQQTFLKLLTTQLRNQDPLNPMNTDQFTQQLVAMTGVQQQILSNELLQQLANNQTGVGSPVDLLGKTVTATSSQATLTGGQAAWQFTTAANAADVQVTITNNLGQTVSQTDLGPLASGPHAYSWNGKDQSGVQLPDGGAYTLGVTATDAAGNAVTSSVALQGPVTAVSTSGGQALLTIDGAQVPASSVTSVQQ